jgi:hypothetical protein
MKIPADFSEEQFAEANSSTFGQFICQRKVIFGWGKGRTAKYEVFQPEVQEGRVFSLSHRTFGFNMLVQIRTLVCAF